MHRVHHSIEPAETNSNFGFNLPWWDWLFGTYRAQPAAGHAGMTIGIDGLPANRRSSGSHADPAAGQLRFRGRGGDRATAGRRRGSGSRGRSAADREELPFHGSSTTRLSAYGRG